MGASAPLPPTTRGELRVRALPLIHAGDTINRILGAITAVDPPFWLGAEPLLRQEIVEINVHWPDGAPAFAPQGGAEVINLARRRFRGVARSVRDGK